MTLHAHMIIVRGLVIGGLLLLFSATTFAGKPENVTEEEKALLPSYCMDTYSFSKYGDGYKNAPNVPKWVGMMGDAFWAMHHYCWALINLNRAQKPTMPAGTRQLTREYAIGDMQYVINNAAPDFVLLPEIYTKIGEVQLNLDRPRDAQVAFVKAQSLKPDYWPPYYRWGDYLRRTGRKKEAREVVEEGLSYSPQSKLLRGLLTELGGDPTTIQPRSVPERPEGPAN